MHHDISQAPVDGSGQPEGRRVIVVHESDSVGTVLDDARSLQILANGLPCVADIPFGHKVALKAITQGSPVLKYGVAIGVATSDIAQGEHVHVHNCR